MGTQVNTINLPFTFTKGEVTTGTPASGYTACGAGTEHPVEATLHQITEMFCRVRNTKITGYAVSMAQSTISYSSLFMGGIPPSQNYLFPDPSVVGWRQFIQRGHIFSKSPQDSVYYDAWLSAHCNPVYQEDGLNYYDGKDELCLWPPPSINTIWNGIAHQSGHQGSFQAAPPTTYGAYSRKEVPSPVNTDEYYGGFIQFIADPLIAFVGGTSPFSSGVKLYPRLGFTDIGQQNPQWIHSSINVGGTLTSAGNAQIVLSSGTLSFPIYLDPSFAPTLVTAPRLEVTEWWPYAKSDGSPAWSTTTGLPI